MVLLHVTDEIINGIIDVHGEYLQTAQKLNLSSNGIRYLDDLYKLNKYLKSLDLSFNDLEETRGLQSLTNIEELNLRGNHLKNIYDMKNMTNLTHLDLAQNEISHLRDIQVLDKFPKLKSLKLEGNPLCKSSLLYPYAVLSAIPTLEVLDGRSREELMMQALQSSQPSPTSYVRPPQQAPVISPPESKNSVPNIQSEEISASHYAQLQQKLAYVVAENAAYEDMFRVAENKLGRNAPIETLKTLDTRAHKPNIDSILSYPYADLLKLWREKVHSLTLRGILDAEEIQSLRKSAENLRSEAEADCESASQTVNMLKARLKAAEDLMAAQADELSTVRNALYDATTKQRQLENEIAGHKQQDKHFRTFLSNFRAEVDQQLVSSSLLEVKLNKRLDTFSTRFAACKDRLQMLQSLYAHKDIEMRNTAAAFEAEKRLLSQWTTDEIQKRTQSDGPQSKDKINDFNLPGSFSSAEPPTLAITPECEAFLRSVFRQLDPDDRGAVSHRVLLQCLHTAASRGLLRCCHSQSNSSEVGASSPRRDNKYCKPPGVPSTDIWGTLIHGLEQLADRSEVEDITWGEFLLLLCPSPTHNNVKVNKNSCMPKMWDLDCNIDEDGLYFDENAGEIHADCLGLSPADFRQLHRSNLLGDLDWAMVPLSLPPSALEAEESALIPTSWLRTVAKGGRNVEFDVSRLKKEAIRLARERAFLLERVQYMNRSLERRAISIRSYFSCEIRKLTLKNETIQRTLRDSQNYAGELEGRLKNLTTDMEQERSQLLTQQDLLRGQVSELQSRLSESSSLEDTAKLEQVLQEYRDMHDRAESELRIVRKELSKSALTQKSLQRDIRRHQATEKACQDMVEDYKKKNKEQKRVIDALDKEQEVLTSRLTAAEKALEAIDAMKREAIDSKGKGDQPQCEVNDQGTQTLEYHVVDDNRDHDKIINNKFSKQSHMNVHPPSNIPGSSITNEMTRLASEQPADRTRTSGFNAQYDREYESYLKSRPLGVKANVENDVLKTHDSSSQLASGLALENMARKLRMMAETLQDEAT